MRHCFEWNSTKSLFIQESSLSVSVIYVIFWSRLSKKAQHLKIKKQTSLQWNQGIVTCFSNMQKRVKPWHFFLQIRLKLVKCIHYLMTPENMLAKWQWKKNGKINCKMESITSEWFFLSWFQHGISKVLKNKEISCFTHEPIRDSV